MDQDEPITYRSPVLEKRSGFVRWQKNTVSWSRITRGSLWMQPVNIAGGKWAFPIKQNGKENMERFKTRLVDMVYLAFGVWLRGDHCFGRYTVHAPDAFDCK